jgi:hypothetical protein
MQRSTVIILVLVGLLVVGLYLAGVLLGAREHGPITIGAKAWFSRPVAIAIGDFVDADHCLENRSLRVRAGQPCTLTIRSTWSPRRRALFLSILSPGMTATVSTPDHPEREVLAELKAGSNELPVDRAGGSVVLACKGPADCVAAVLKEP